MLMLSKTNTVLKSRARHMSGPSLFYSDEFTNYIEINGTTVGEMMFLHTESFAEIEFGLVELDEGENRIDISAYWGFFDVDYIKIGERGERSPISQVSPVLVTPEPSPEAQALMEYI